MNGLSLFKVQSLVAIALCTSLNAWGADVPSTRVPAKPGDPDPADAAATPGDSNAGSSSSNLATIRATCKKTAGSSTSDEYEICVESKSGNLTEVNSRDRKCKDTSERAQNLQTNVTQALNAQFAAQGEKLDKVVKIQETAVDAQRATTDANTEYQTAIAAINLTLPGKIAAANSAAAKELLKLRGEMEKLGNDRAKAEIDLDEAKQKILDLEIQMQQQCSDFASGKANAKLDALDKARNDLLGRANTYVNYGTTTVAGAQKRRNAKRANDAQKAYMAAYSACMSGQGDLNGGAGGGAGPGASLKAALVQAQNRLPQAEKIYKAALDAIEAQRQMILQQMAQLESDKNEQIKAIAAQAQVEFNAAQAKLTTAINGAQAEIAKSKIELTVKGQLYDAQAKAANDQWLQASQQAYGANIQAAQACGDPGQAAIPGMNLPTTGTNRRSKN